MAVLFAWLIAQIAKTIIHLLTKKSFKSERLYGSGGMPSSHSCGVTTLSICAGKLYGCGSFQFAIATLIAILVIYDASGVRREAGKHAKLLNQIIEIATIKEKVDFDNKLNELIGHSGLQIFAGILLGAIYSTVIILCGLI